LREDARVLLTFDKDFGELAWRTGLPESCGIVLFHLPALGPGSHSRGLRIDHVPLIAVRPVSPVIQDDRRASYKMTRDHEVSGIMRLMIVAGKHYVFA
jgi:hypothetical protein